MTRYLNIKSATALLIVGAALATWSAAPTFGQSTGLHLLSSSIVSEFPGGFRITAEATGDKEIEAIVVHLQMGQVTSGTFDYLCTPSGGNGQLEPGKCEELKPAKLVKGELFWRTDRSVSYLPPGTSIRYYFDIQDVDGGKLVTEEQVFIYYDARYEWSEVSDGTISVAYHGPVKTRAETILATIQETVVNMQPVLGFAGDEPIRVTIYNNNKEMLGALPPGSETVSRELITEGQAYANYGVLMMLGGGRRARGTASHEVTHILVHRAGDSIFRRIPLWLNEGLAEYANVEPGFAYDIALDFAVDTDTLLPSFGGAYPGEPEQTIIFYGQARSIVLFMVETWGQARMRLLMATMKTGKRAAQAIEEVYGFGLRELDDRWRSAIGAQPYVPPEGGGRSRPTPLPLPKLGLYSLTPQPDTQAIEATADTPTPEPEPTETPTPEAIAAVPPAEPAAEAVEPATGSGCLAVKGGGGAADATMLGLVLGLVGLGARRRRRRRD